MALAAAALRAMFSGGSSDREHEHRAAFVARVLQVGDAYAHGAAFGLDGRPVEPKKYEEALQEIIERFLVVALETERSPSAPTLRVVGD